MTRAKKRKRRGIVRNIIFLLILLAAGYGGWTWFQGRRSPKAMKVFAHTLELSDFEQRVDGTGILEAREQLIMSFPIAGKIAEVNVKLGDTVEAGQVLAKLEENALRRELTSQQQNLNAARLERGRIASDQDSQAVSLNAQQSDAQRRLENAFDSLREAQSKLSQNERLLAVGGVSSNDVEQSRVSVSQAERNVAGIQTELATLSQKQAASRNGNAAQLSRQDANISQLETKLSDAQRQLGQTELRAPFSGVIYSVGVRVGDNVAAAESLSENGRKQQGIGLLNPQSLYINASFPEQRSLNLSLGQAAEVSLQADRDASKRATISQIAPTIDRSSRDAQLEVNLDFVNLSDSSETDTPLRAGNQVRVQVITERMEQVLTVPLEALEQDDLVYKLVPTNNPADEGLYRLEAIPITIEARNNSVAVVAGTNSTGTSLQAGDHIAITAGLEVSEDDVVAVEGGSLTASTDDTQVAGGED